MTDKEYIRFNSIQNMFVCITLTLVGTYLTSKDFSLVSLVLGVIQSYVINQTLTFMININAVDDWFHSLTKMKDRGLSNSIINTLIYATVINALNTIWASRVNFFGNYFHLYPYLLVVGTIAGWIYGPYSAKIARAISK